MRDNTIHGIFGGYDQAYGTCENYVSDCRIIAPARFGYLGSDVYGDGTPAEQAKAYIELLDQLNIDKVYLLATSAGGSVAIRFALDYPERTKGLILYCSAMPRSEKPKRVIEYKMNVSWMCNDYSMYLTAPLYNLFFGIDSMVINGIIPCEDRKTGVKIDMIITNYDMARNYDSYQIESLKMPTLIFQAKDDRLVRYSESKKSVKRFQNCTFIPFEKGGSNMEMMNLRKRMLPISADDQKQTELTFDWRAFEEGDYADYSGKMEHGLMYSGDYIGCIRVGDLCIDLSVYSLQQDGPIGSEDEAQLVLDFFVGGVDTGYAYGRNGYPYDNVEEARYRFEDDKAGLEYADFQKSIEDMIMLRILQTEYGNADLIKKAADRLHIW